MKIKETTKANPKIKAKYLNAPVVKIAKEPIVKDAAVSINSICFVERSSLSNL